MSTRMKDLVKTLQTKNQEAEVEFVVVYVDGELICVDITEQAGAFMKVLKLFGPNQGEQTNG